MFYLTGYVGLSDYSEKWIWIANDQNNNEQIISLLHEFFHFYFHDQQDNRKRIPKNQDKDPIERRAENSAENTLSWYKKNTKKFNELKRYVATIQVEECDLDEF